jgi:tetratricopeptide (TPR) repeat protein
MPWSEITLILMAILPVSVLRLLCFRIILIRKENKRNNEKDFYRTTARFAMQFGFVMVKQNQKILSWMQISFKNFFRILNAKGNWKLWQSNRGARKANKFKPDDASVYYELGKNYLALKEYKSAYSSFEKLLKSIQKTMVLGWNVWCELRN